MPKDPYADEFGVPSVEDLVGDTRSTMITRDLESLDKRLHDLPPLNGRAPITDDVFESRPSLHQPASVMRLGWRPSSPRCSRANSGRMAKATQGCSASEYVNIGRSADALTIPEMQQRHREWTNLVRRGADAPEPRPDPSHNPERAAAELWSEFGARLPSLTSDSQAVCRAVTKIVEAGEFDPNNRDAFYNRIAAELKPDTSRTDFASGRGAGTKGEPKAFGAADSRKAFDDDFRAASRGFQR
jgi:hypothetical protein